MSRSFGLACGALTVAIVAATVPSLIVPAAVASSVAALFAPRPGSRRVALGGVSLWPVAVGAALIVGRVVVGSLGAPAAGAGTHPSPSTGTVGPAGASAGQSGGRVLGEIGSVMRRAGGRQDVVLAVPGVGAVYARLPRFPEFGPGDVIRADGAIEPLPEDPAPDDAAWVAYLRRIGVDGALEARSAAAVARHDDPSTQLASVRDAAGDALEAALPEPAAGLAAGILIGLRERVDPGLAKDFTAAGLTHVVAISGWNIAIIGGVCGALVRPLRRRSRAIVVATVIGAYTVFAGASPSVVRAALMAGVALVSRESGRRAGAMRALALAVTMMLVLDPAAVADPGFQLSACATLGLIAWATPLGGALGSRLPRLPAIVRESLAVSLSAQAATLPIVLFDFGRISLVSPVANLVAAPLVPFVMAAAAAALPLGIALESGAPTGLLGVPLALVSVPVQLLIGVARVAASVPYASVQLPPAAAMAAAAVAFVAVIAVARLRAPTRASARASPPASSPSTP